MTEAWRLRSNLERTEGCAFQFLGGDEEVFPLALGGFRLGIDEDVAALRATFRTPVAIHGIIVAILEVENHRPDWDVNVDMEYVGVEGYTYE